MAQKPETETQIPRVVSTILAAWLLAIGFDFMLHAGVLAQLYTRSSPFLLEPAEAFRRIPAGYSAFLLLTAALYWLFVRLDIGNWFDGLRIGLVCGLVIWGAAVLGLYSISTASPELLLGWWVGQGFELALSGSVIGSSRGGASLKSIWLKVAAAIVVLGVATVILQTTGWAPAVTNR